MVLRVGAPPPLRVPYLRSLEYSFAIGHPVPCRSENPNLIRAAGKPLFLLPDQLFPPRKYLQSNFSDSLLHPLHVRQLHQIILVYWDQVMILG